MVSITNHYSWSHLNFFISLKKNKNKIFKKKKKKKNKKKNKKKQKKTLHYHQKTLQMIKVVDYSKLKYIYLKCK